MIRNPSQIRGANNKRIFELPDSVVHLIGDPGEDLRSETLHCAGITVGV